MDITPSPHSNLAYLLEAQDSKKLSEPPTGTMCQGTTVLVPPFPFPFQRSLLPQELKQLNLAQDAGTSPARIINSRYFFSFSFFLLLVFKLGLRRSVLPHRYPREGIFDVLLVAGGFGYQSTNLLTLHQQRRYRQTSPFTNKTKKKISEQINPLSFFFFNFF